MAPPALPGQEADATITREFSPAWTRVTPVTPIRNDGARDRRDIVTISMPVEPDANDLLSRDPLALLIGMLLDQQVPLERAFSAPYDLARRLGHEPTAAELADYDPEALAAVFAERPALHRYPKSMAARVQALSQLIVARYGGEASRVWGDAVSGAELRQRVAELPGFGAQKAQIFVALLGKQLGVQPPGWREAAGTFGEPGTFCSVADISDEDSLGRVRAYKQRLKAAAKGAPAKTPEGTAQAPGGTAQAPGGTAQAAGGTAQAAGGTAQAAGGTAQAAGGGTKAKAKSR